MKTKVEYNQQISLDHISKVLPVDVKFSKKRFIELTGINPSSSMNKLRDLTCCKLLTRYSNRGLKSFYSMSAEQATAMRFESAVRQANRSRKAGTQVEHEPVEKTAYDNGVEFLKSIKFI